jgi:signal transduction histidine kinase
MKSIRHELTRRLIIWLTGLLSVGLLGVYLAVSHELVEGVDTTLRVRALSVAALTRSELGQVRFDFSPDFLAAYQAKYPRHYFEVRAANGNVLMRSPSLRDLDLPWRVGGSSQRPIYYNITLPNGRVGRATALEFYATTTAAPHPATGIEPPQSLQLVEALDRTELNETLGGILGVIFGCGVLLSAAIWLLVPRVLVRGLAPLSRLGEDAAKIDADSLATRFSEKGLPTELQPIGRRLNDLLARLEASFERERRFNADLAHELRTPIAELRSLAECALKWPDARVREMDQDIFDIATHMDDLTTRLLTLARGETGRLMVQLAPLDISHQVTEAWHPFLERANRRGVTASFDVPSESVPADVVLLRSILYNLFDNAVDYAPAGSEVRISGESSHGGYRLHVANLAPALSAEDAAHCFERLWRKDAARSGGDHVGLGLSLARTFGAAMGWNLTAKIDDAGWLILTLARTSSLKDVARND